MRLFCAGLERKKKLLSPKHSLKYVKQEGALSKHMILGQILDNWTIRTDNPDNCRNEMLFVFCQDILASSAFKTSPINLGHYKSRDKRENEELYLAVGQISLL